MTTSHADILARVASGLSTAADADKLRRLLDGQAETEAYLRGCCDMLRALSQQKITARAKAPATNICPLCHRDRNETGLCSLCQDGQDEIIGARNARLYT